MSPVHVQVDGFEFSLHLNSRFKITDVTATQLVFNIRILHKYMQQYS